MKNWKLIFNTNNYHYILIKEPIKEKYLKFFFNHRKAIESVSSFYCLIPTEDELQNGNIKKNISKYAQSLKNFLSNENKKTLFIEEDLLKILVKEEKQTSFFRFIANKQKNIVLFYYSDIGNYAKMSNYSHIEMTEKELEENYHLFDQFADIKNKFNKIKLNLKENE